MAPNDGTATANPNIRTFKGGATRDSAGGKSDYEGFLSPTALVRYGQYMNQHRVQSNGKLRKSDNWQSGIPVEDYMSSLLRHVMDLWVLHRGGQPLDLRDGHKITKQEALCGVLFNAFGYLHELLR